MIYAQDTHRFKNTNRLKTNGYNKTFHWKCNYIKYLTKNENKYISWKEGDIVK